ncbi:Polysaccharide monooxygenase Cel61a 4 [Emericellopsis cladophorae]|uniref:lytic cellulose monooxygenase (C4-dehydrogenating) n=1 Tax=Emericellopsis cladophorae TaxID=2686198 RepID=A0A9P9XXE1_9HYPO|nr:Polysaccharide monooxygenase Cel61a 4 [Emericellopsis cladophorae]KAI6779416.1 Polysaccharide monooxygenase Cel61a 4 [Emericellopsis cladophorae]
MKFSTLALAAAAQVASAHYWFDTNVIDGAAQAPGKYVRGTTRATAYNPIKFSSNPAGDIRDGSFADGDDIICNQGAFSTAGNTEVLTVAAGSDVTAKLAFGAKMEHPGPGFVYMSRAPGDDVKAYDGAGDWFKVFEEGVCNPSADFTSDAWCTWGRDTITATIPAGTPDGEYLVRFEHIGVHRSHVNQPEHYTSCLQVRVEGGGSGTPGPTFQLPGGYKDTDDYANFSIYNGFKDFPMPGPAVWDGTSSGSAPVEEEQDDAPAEQPAPAPVEEEQPAPGVECLGMYFQCGGNGYTGPTCCSTGSCKVVNDWYHQCL